MLETEFPPGTAVRVKQVVPGRERDIETETDGVIEAWGEAPTGSWFAHGKDGRLWLARLTLRKASGELTTLVVDDGSSIAKVKPVPSERA